MSLNQLSSMVFVAAVMSGCGANESASTATTEPSATNTTNTTNTTTETQTSQVTDVSPVTTVSVSDNPTLVLEKIVDIELSAPNALAVACTRVGFESEVHLLESAVNAAHTLRFAGLVAETTYNCVVGTPEKPGQAVYSFEMTTDALPNRIPEGSVTEGGFGKMVGAYTLFTSQMLCEDDLNIHLVLVGPEGEVRWYYALPLQGYADMGAEYYGDGQFLWGGVSGTGNAEGAPHLVTVSHEEVYVAQYPESQSVPFHHMCEAADDGSVLTLTEEMARDGAREFTGFGIHHVDIENDSLLWSWSVQEAIDRGQLQANGVWDYGGNWTGSMNDGVEEVMVVSLCDVMSIIAVSKNTGDVAWSMAPWGSLDLTAGSYAECTHGLDVRGNRLLAYDNGWEGPSSRVVEYEIDGAAQEATQVWSWTEPNWHEYVWGDVDYLGEDHVLLNRGHLECYSGGNGPSQIVEIDKTNDEVIWRLALEDDRVGTYGADRIDGCEIFSDVRWCEGLTSRLSELNNALTD